MDKRQTSVVSRFLKAADGALAAIEGDTDSQAALHSFDASYQTIARERYLPPALMTEVQSLKFALTDLRGSEILTEIAAMKGEPVAPPIRDWKATSLRDAKAARQKVASHLASGVSG